MSRWKTVKVSWTNLPLLVASGVLLVVAWFVPSYRDPGGDGDIMLSMVLTVRALSMPPSKWVTFLGCSGAVISLAGNAGLLPGGSWRIPIFVMFVLLLIAVLFWERLTSRRSRPKLSDPNGAV